MIINGIEIFFGKKPYTHQELQTAIGAEIADKILEKSGFRHRNVTTSNTDILEIAKQATQQPAIFEKLNSADCIIVVSEYVQKIVPPPSTWILSDQVSERQLVIDLNRGCSGFCEALVLAQHFFLGGKMNKAAIITAENYSKIISPNNRTLAPIFSDAVAFTFIEFCPDHAMHSNYGFDHTRASDLMYQSKKRELYMNGAGLISFVKSKVLPNIDKLLKKNFGDGSINYFFAHQGSKLVIDAINQQLAGKLPKAEFLSGDIGNINSSSIPYVMKSTLGFDPKPVTVKALLSGFGVGLSYCNVLLDIVYKNDHN